MLPFIKKEIQKSIPAARWLVTVFSDPKIVIEFFFDCCNNDMRRFIVGILVQAFQVLYQIEGQGANNRLLEENSDGYPTTILANCINCFINCIKEARGGSNRDYTEFFSVFYKIAKLGEETLYYLLHKKLIGRLLDFFYDTNSVSIEIRKFMKDLSDVNFGCPEKGLMGDPSQEKKKKNSAYEEILSKKKDKIFSEPFCASKVYLWQTISELLKYSGNKFNLINPLSADKINYELKDEEY